MCKYCESKMKIYNKQTNIGTLIRENYLYVFTKKQNKLKILLKMKIDVCPFCNSPVFSKGTKVHTIKIEQKLPSLNDYINKCKHSIGYARTFKEETDNIIGWELKKQKLDKLKITKPIIAYIKYIEPRRDRDVDNVYSASKYIFDGLQKMGIIENDNPSHLIDIKNSIDYDNTKQKGEIIIKLVEQ